MAPCHVSTLQIGGAGGADGPYISVAHPSAKICEIYSVNSPHTWLEWVNNSQDAERCERIHTTYTHDITVWLWPLWKHLFDRADQEMSTTSDGSGGGGCGCGGGFGGGGAAVLLMLLLLPLPLPLLLMLLLMALLPLQLVLVVLEGKRVGGRKGMGVP